MDRELKNLTLNISQLAALSGVHRQTAAARLQNLPVAGGHESNLKLYRVVDIVSAFLALTPPVAEGEMDAHERKAWYQSERERLSVQCCQTGVCLLGKSGRAGAGDITGYS